LTAVTVQELGCGLKVRTCETGVGMGAVLLGWPSAIAVGKAVSDPVDVVLDPLGVRGERVGIVWHRVTSNVDPLAMVGLEGFSGGAVEDLGVAVGHPWGLVAEHLLDYVLGDAGVETGNENCSKRANAS
jgi:hypothetical protein